MSHAELVALVRYQQALIVPLEETVATQTTTIRHLEQRSRAVDPAANPPHGMPGMTTASSITPHQDNRPSA